MSSSSSIKPSSIKFFSIQLSSIFRSIPSRAWILVGFSALLQVLIFPMAGPVPALRTAIAWFALIPFLAALLLTTRNGTPLNLKQTALLGYVCGILWYAGNCYWIYQTMNIYGGMPKPVALGVLILFSLYIGLYHSLLATLLALVHRSRFGIHGALLVTPFAWVAVELARGRITGFPWDLLGVSQVDNLLLTRIAPFAGVMSLSFILAAVNACFTAAIFTRGKKRILLFASAAVIALILQSGTPFSRHAFADTTDQLAILMQDNIEVGKMATPQDYLAPDDEIRLFSQLSEHPTTYSTLTQPTVVIWPEAPADLYSFDPYFLQQLGRLTRSLNVPGIIGTLGVDRTNLNQRGYFKYDSASLFDPDGAFRGRYDKVHLVPWGEYVPFKAFFGFFVTKLTKDAGDMDPGTQRTVFDSAGHRYGIFICYESIFGDEIRQFTLNGAQVLVNISDDGWYGDTGAPWQHLNMTRMRAIENRRWLLLDANTGVTTSIDPLGRTVAQAPRHTRGAYAFPFAFASGLTFYTRHGDWFAWLCALVTLASIAAATLLSNDKIAAHRP
jgi:apolipoprotein N-acyltransferase